jgi:uncharacterized tellurite resistance protein B-like protein
VFLYFYGLEFRLLKDLPATQAGRFEGKQILAEIARLRQHYGDKRSFRSYSDELLAFGRFRLGIEEDERVLSGTEPWSTAAQIAIARFVAARRALPGNLALLWARALSDDARSGIWDAVLPEVQERFGQLYDTRYPEGLVLAPGRSKLTIEYRWASPCVGVDVVKTDLPDVNRVVAPIRPLVGLLQQALIELDPLRRVRRSKSANALAEFAALPEPLRRARMPDTFKSLVEHLTSLTSGGKRARVLAAEIIKGVGLKEGDKLGKRDATALIQGLEALGFAMEPDVRFHGAAPTPDGDVIVFPLTVDAARNPSPAYAAAMLMVQAALAVAGSGDDLLDSEFAATIKAIERQFALPQSERVRLEAHIEWSRNNPPSARRLEGKVRLLPKCDREAFAGVLLEIAGADGHISPGEVRVIERFYRTLELDVSRVHADLHNASLGTRRHPTPAGEQQKATLDADVIALKLSETARVQSVLSQIFVGDDEASQVAQAAPVAVRADIIDGLDEAHLALLERVLAVPVEEWSRLELESICGELGLLPDGAVEILNEVSFSRAGEALLEGDDPLYVSRHAQDSLAAALLESKEAFA